MCRLIRSGDNHVTFVLKLEMEGLLCPFCLFFAPSQQLLHKHVISVHSLDSNFKIQCDCLRTFRNYRTYHNHQLCCVERSRVLLQRSSPSDSSAINFIDSNQILELEPREQEIIVMGQKVLTRKSMVPSGFLKLVKVDP